VQHSDRNSTAHPPRCQARTEPRQASAKSGHSSAGTLLAQMGVRSTVFDRAPGPPTHPQAHFISNRTMELLRTLWLPTAFAPSADATAQAHLSSTGQAARAAVEERCTPRPGVRSVADAVEAVVPPFEQWRCFRYVDALVGGQPLGVVDHFPGTKHSCCGAAEQAKSTRWHLQRYAAPYERAAKIAVVLTTSANQSARWPSRDALLQARRRRGKRASAPSAAATCRSTRSCRCCSRPRGTPACAM
jgi:FAD binding domain